jgi:hypothetical protein
MMSYGKQVIALSLYSTVLYSVLRTQAPITPVLSTVFYSQSSFMAARGLDEQVLVTRTMPVMLSAAAVIAW